MLDFGNFRKAEEIKYELKLEIYPESLS